MIIKLHKASNKEEILKAAKESRGYTQKNKVKSDSFLTEAM